MTAASAQPKPKRRGIALGERQELSPVILRWSSDVQRIALETLRSDSALQQREFGIQKPIVDEYAETIADWIDQAPVIVYRDEEGSYWIADGFHRVSAAWVAGLVDIPAEVRSGTRRDALLCALGANSRHGLRRTNADKRKAVATVLADPEWSTWSNRRIAEICGVSDMFVGKERALRVQMSVREKKNPSEANPAGVAGLQTVCSPPQSAGEKAPSDSPPLAPPPADVTAPSLVYSAPVVDMVEQVCQEFNAVRTRVATPVSAANRAFWAKGCKKQIAALRGRIFDLLVLIDEEPA